MRRLALAALTAFCLLCPVAAEAKKPRLGLLSGSEFGISQIDTYRGYYESPKGTLQIVNTRLRTTRAVVLPDGCEATDVRRALVLLGCGEWASFELWNSFTHEATPLDLSRCDSNNHTIGLGQIGRYWIAGSYDIGYEREDDGTGHEVYSVVYLNRASGECRVYVDGFNRGIDDPDLPPPRYGVPDRCTRGKRFIAQFRSRGGTYAKLCTKHARWRRTGCDGSEAIGRNLLACGGAGRVRVYLPASGRLIEWRVGGYDSTLVLGDRVFVDVYGVARGIPIYTVDLTRLVQP